MLPTMSVLSTVTGSHAIDRNSHSGTATGSIRPHLSTPSSDRMFASKEECATKPTLSTFKLDITSLEVFGDQGDPLVCQSGRRRGTRLPESVRHRHDESVEALARPWDVSLQSTISFLKQRMSRTAKARVETHAADDVRERTSRNDRAGDENG